MRTVFRLLLLLVFSQGALAATVSGSFTADEQLSSVLQMNPAEQLKVTLSGTWSGTVALQFREGTSAWRTIHSYTANLTAEKAEEAVGAGAYRLRMSTYSSGTVTYSAVTSGVGGAGSVDLTTGVTGTLPIGNGGTGLASAADDTLLLSNGAVIVATAVPNCLDSSGNHLNYATSTNAFSCGTSSSGGGGGDPWTSQTCTTNCTISTNYRRVDCDATAGNVTVTLGALATYTDVEVGKIDTSANTCTVDPNASETIGSDAHLTDVIVAPDTVLTYRKFSSTNWLLR